MQVLDAPDLQDDFYLNLVDWSSQNVLCVGLGSCVYLWSACTSQVTKLCDLRDVVASTDLVTSVKWMGRGSHLAIGTNTGDVQVCPPRRSRCYFIEFVKVSSTARIPKPIGWLFQCCDTEVFLGFILTAFTAPSPLNRSPPHVNR